MSGNGITKQEETPNFAQLVELCEGSEKRALFFLAWLKHNKNSTLAYKELHPKVTDGSARVLGSIALANINTRAILAAYELGPEAYFEQLREGIKANRKRAEVVDRDTKGAPIYAYVDEPDHKTRRSYHEALGKILGIEVEDQFQVNVLQQFNQGSKDPELDEIAL